ncbi:MAG: tRNA preQ1(34) S-adenosylmethionine ribosyltransferase-isomerase QueA [Candidatus Marinimicrobia bacterium]|nr:tRNA preQ1(34) S-adenosylmethionine ribosyltransferase-isomerase QueA [Candidatus Neomarinimicrobiota bacterium]
MIQKKKKYKLADFDYALPKKYIAQYPAKRRDGSKLMVIHRDSGEIEHKKFSNLTDYFRKNDLFMLNNTKVFPARLFANKDRTEAKVEVFLLRELENDLWEVMVKPARKVRIGNKLMFAKNVYCDVIDNTISGGRVVRFEYEDEDIYSIIDRIGLSPLPPYINRDAVASDKVRYQTVYADRRGAVAAPTAGLHFTDGMINKLKKKQIKIDYTTLHIGLGTFRPVQVEDLNRHQMDSEYFELSPSTALVINETKKKRRKVVAVGTSTVRSLETVVVSGFQVTPKRGWTDKFIYPPYDFKMVDALITNFHQPKSTLLMMVSAFASRKLIMHAYSEAKKKKYRFLSYGDAMLIL